MIARLDMPIEPQYAKPVEQTPGRREGLVNFAATLDRTFGVAQLRWSHFLDVGGGDGWLSSFLDYGRYVCIDPQYHPGILGAKGVIGRAEALPFKDKYFDFVVSKQTLLHFDDPVRACREMLRVSRYAVVIRQEFPEPERPIGWPGHSRVTIDDPEDILIALKSNEWRTKYNGTDFIVVRIDPLGR
jgi:SAM-dependent methyltransferase